MVKTVPKKVKNTTFNALGTSHFENFKSGVSNWSFLTKLLMH